MSEGKLRDQKEIDKEAKRAFFVGLTFIVLWFVFGMIAGAYIMKDRIENNLVKDGVACWVADEDGDPEFSTDCPKKLPSMD